MPSSRKPMLTAVQFEEGVVALQYILPADMKANGAQRHTTTYVPRGDDYDDEIAAIEDAVFALVADIDDDWASLRTVEDMKRTQRQDEEEDEDE